MPRFHKKKRKPRIPENPDAPTPPSSILIHRGSVGRSLKVFEQDLRALLLPHTALHLKERRSNNMRDFLAVAGPLGVSHLLVLSSTDLGAYLRILRTPQGPTLTFRMHEYTLTHDVLAIQKHPHSSGSHFNAPPLVVLNNFTGGGKERELCSTILQSMFPPLNVQTVRFSDCRRVVLFDFDSEADRIEVRHYLVTFSSVGVSQPVKKLFHGSRTNIPDLGSYRDIADYVLQQRSAVKTEDEQSETDEFAPATDGDDDDEEDDEEDVVELPTAADDDDDEKKRLKKLETNGGSKAASKKNRRKKSSGPNAVRLHEIGPRMLLQLVKVQEGFGDGEVIYHAWVQKTPEEKAALRARQKELAQLKLQRQREQEKNYRRKHGDAEPQEEEQPKQDEEEQREYELDVEQPSDDEDTESDEEPLERERNQEVKQEENEQEEEFSNVTDRVMIKRDPEQEEEAEATSVYQLESVPEPSSSAVSVRKQLKRVFRNDQAREIRLARAALQNEPLLQSANTKWAKRKKAH